MDVLGRGRRRARQLLQQKGGRDWQQSGRRRLRLLRLPQGRRYPLGTVAHFFKVREHVFELQFRLQIILARRVVPPAVVPDHPGRMELHKVFRDLPRTAAHALAYDTR